jgi:Putative Ig domain/Bacterial Ig-like domain (group 3)
LGNFEAGGAQAVDFWRMDLNAGEQVIVNITPSLQNYFLFQLFPPSTTDTTLLSATPAVSVGTNNLSSSYAFRITAPYTGDFVLAICQGYGVSDCAGVLYQDQGTNPMSPYTFTTTPIVDPTSTSVSCSPTTLTTGSSTTCKATVTDTASAGATTPVGTVRFTASPASGAFGSPGSCALAGVASAVASCRITVKPSAPGSYRITGTYGGDSGHAASRGKSAPVTALAPLRITTTSLPAAVMGKPYAGALVATGGQGPYSWSLPTGKLPPGLRLSSSGKLSGTPSKAGSYSFSARVSDSGRRTATRELSINIGEIAIKTSSLPAGKKGARYLADLAVYGGTGKLTWSLSGHLPKGLALSQSGTISGKPEAVGTFSLDITVKDQTGATATKPLVLVIRA